MLNVPPGGLSKSLKKQMVELLDQYLLGYISPKDLLKATVPMVMVSTHKKGRKNYIERMLLELSGKSEHELTRDYIYAMREMLTDEVSDPKDRKKVLKRTLRKLIERYVFEEIEMPYFLSMIYDLAVDFHVEIASETAIKHLIDSIQLLNFSPEVGSSPESEKQLVDLVTDFYEDYYKGLWDE